MKRLFNAILDVLGFLVVGSLLYFFFTTYEDSTPTPPLALNTTTAPVIYPEDVEYQPGSKSFFRNLTSPCYRIAPEVFEACDIHQTRPSVVPLVQPENAGQFNLGQVCDLFDYISQWEYINDPYMEDFYSPSSYSLEQRRGDCDDYAICLAAALQSVGGYPRITFADYSDRGHAFTEICLGPMSERVFRSYIINRYQLPRNVILHYRKDDKDNIYLNMDWTANHPGAPYRYAIKEMIFYPIPQKCETIYYNRS